MLTRAFLVFIPHPEIVQRTQKYQVNHPKDEAVDKGRFGRHLCPHQAVKQVVNRYDEYVQNETVP
jgi:hypothetical protein